MNDQAPQADSAGDQSQQPPQPRWQPLTAVDRRVAGVLVEKAKTTPEAYPMSVNAISTACNQKSNRFPVMELQPEQVVESLERLRELGAVGLIEGYGRVAKYRHYLYDWLGVDKVELAVMAELLLRGDQTEGELRARASRMEPIGDLAALRPVLDSLKAKGLVVALTPQGRGHVVTHALYQAQELETIKGRYAAGRTPTVPPAEGADSSAAEHRHFAAASPAPRVDPAVVQSLQRDLDQLRAEVTRLRSDLDELSAGLKRMEGELQRSNAQRGSAQSV